MTDLLKLIFLIFLVSCNVSNVVFQNSKSGYKHYTSYNLSKLMFQIHPVRILLLLGVLGDQLQKTTTGESGPSVRSSYIDLHSTESSREDSEEVTELAGIHSLTILRMYLPIFTF